MYLVSWLTVLDSVPEIELVTFLPDFLEGLIVFLGDATTEIRTATQNVLADFLREIKEIAHVHQAREDARLERDRKAKSPLINGDQEGNSPDPDAASPNPSVEPSMDPSSPIIPEADEQSTIINGPEETRG